MTAAIEFDPRWIRRNVAPFLASFLVTLLGGTVDARAKEDELSTDAPVAEQPTSPAQLLFQAGREAMKQGDFELACKKFGESYHAEPAVGTLLNLGNCEERRGRLATAFSLYTEAIDRLDAGDPRADFARKRAEELRRRAPTLTVTVDEAAPEEVLVTRNGEPLTKELGKKVRLDPGRVVVVVEASGHSPRVYQLQLAPGDAEELSVAAGERIEPETQQVTMDASSTTIAGYVLLATGAASGVTAGTFAWLTQQQYAIVKEHCDVDTQACFDAAGKTAADKGATYETLAYVFGGVAVASLSIGGYLLLTDDDTASTAHHQLTFSVVTNGSDSPGLVLGGTF
jgi:hypothetical protein